MVYQGRCAAAQHISDCIAIPSISAGRYGEMHMHISRHLLYTKTIVSGTHHSLLQLY